MCYWLTQCSLKYMKLDSCIVHDERLKWWDAVAFDIVSYISFHSSTHSSLTLIPPSVSCFCLTFPGGLLSRSSIYQHHPGGWQCEWGPGEWHQTWDAGLGSTAIQLYLSCWPLHLSVHDLDQALAGQKESLTTNDKWQSQNKHTREGGEQKKSWITLSSSISQCCSSH